MRSLPLILLLATACARNELSVFTEYLSIESLPSYRLGTPDPRLYCPDYGEKLHIRWSVTDCDCSDNLSLHLSILYGNGETYSESVALNAPTGIYVYTLLNDKYWSKEGIFSFKVDLYSNDKLIREWRHQLYAERIEILPVTPTTEEPLLNTCDEFDIINREGSEAW